MVLDTDGDENLELQGDPEPDSLKFLTNPGESVGNTAAGQPIGGVNGFVVEVADEFGNLDTGFNGAITLNLSSDAETISTPTNNLNNLPFAAGSITSVSAVNGVAIFNDVVIDQTGTGYFLTASSAGGSTGGFAVTPAVSTTFNVPAGVATQIAITTEPISTVQFADVPVIVSLEDPFGNIDYLDNYSTVDLTVNSGPAGFSVPVTATAVGGIVSFDLTFGVPGTYTLLATDPFEGFPSVISSSFVISPVTTQQRGLNGTIISAPGINQQQERNGPVQAG